METRARYVLMGLFSLVVILAGFGFVYWIENTGGLAERSTYRIRFQGTVSGLLLGSAVQFNGIRVGEVTGLDLDPDDPRQVFVTVAVRRDTPVRTDAEIGLVFGGLTGVPEIALSGGTPDAARPALSEVLLAQAGAGTDWTAAARDAFVRVGSLLSDNSDALGDTLANLDTFSEALARNSESFDDIIAGLARLAGARAGGKIETFYTLSPATGVRPIGEVPQGQLVVNQPIVPPAFDTQRLMLHSESAGDQAVFEGVGWSDTMPRAVQTAIIRSFENAGYSRVGRDFQGLAADHTLVVDMDVFRVVEEPAVRAEIGLSASIVDNAGSIIAAKRFEAEAQMKEVDAESAAQALDAAFEETEKALVAWTLDALSHTDQRE